jgi:hypothetical protein
MAKMSSTRASAFIAVVTALLLTGIGCGLPVDSARAADDNCATAPGAAAPKGQHWYYRVNSATHRRCWYLHATVPRAAVDSRSTQSESVRPAAAPQSPSAATPQAANAASAPPSPANVANAPSEAAAVQPTPHVTMLNVKTVNAPGTDPMPSSEAATPEQLNAPMPPISGNTNVKLSGDAKPVSRATHATAPAAPDNGHDALAPANTEATAAAQTPSAQLFLLLLLLALGAAAAIALLIKMASLARSPHLSEHPGDVWRSYVSTDEPADDAVVNHEDAPFLAPQEPYGAIDWGAPERLKQSSPARADFWVPRPQHGNRDGRNR